VDSLIDGAIAAYSDAGKRWQAVLRQIEADQPAVFIYASTYVFPVNRRLNRVSFHPASIWLLLREWSVK
jgi:hypothetical protein